MAAQKIASKTPQALRRNQLIGVMKKLTNIPNNLFLKNMTPAQITQLKGALKDWSYKGVS